MSSILVVEPEHRYVERINEALSGEGWKVRVVEGRDQALQAAASEAPDLVVVSAEVPGIELLTSSFSRNVGGPGVLALLPEDAGGPSAAGGVVADDLLAKPFSDQDLLAGVRRGLAASAAAAAARRSPSPQRASPPEHKLTSQEIFADVLADLDEAPSLAPPPRAAAPPPPAPSAPAASSAMSAGERDIERRLEKTLSGLPGGDPRPRTAAPAPPVPAPAAPVPVAQAPAAPPRRPAEASTGDVDALLSRTLGNLELGARPKPAEAPRPAAPVVARPAAPVQPAPPPSAPPTRPAAPPAPAAAASPAAPPQEGTAVRKAPKTVGDFDFSELEELARTGRRPATQGTSPGTAVRPAVAAVPVAAPPPVAQTPISTPAPAPIPRPAVAAAPPPAAPRVEPPPPIAPSPMVPMAPVTPVGARVTPTDDPGATQRIPIVPRQEPGSPGEHFGQYQLLERIAVGGMAEVWKARMRGVEGFQKMVAIKKILSHMTDNAEFIGMFIDEAKLAAQLNHPNIVHIYDLGKIGRDYYIAMEYVEGKDLRSLLNASRRKGMPLPMGLALLIAARLASALNYAHRKRDYEGKELGLVHRDVSPQNVLITPDGDVKLCDFGIAKAVSKAGQTQIGSLKGKLQYMSPEQAWGRQVDSRSDIFSLGAVLFEMLTAERLFPGDSEMSVLEAVRQVRTRRTREVVPTIPQDVDDIVARALANEPADRFQNAGEMEQRLDAVLAGLIPAAPNHTDLSAYVRRVLAPQEDEDEIAIPEFHFSSEPRTATPPAVPTPPVQAAPPAQPVPLPVPAPQIPPAPQPLHVPPPLQVAPAQATAAPAPVPGAEAVSTPPPPHALPVAEEPVVEPLEEPVVEPVAPLGEVLMEEEGPQKGRRMLYLLIGGLLLLAVLTFLWLANRSSAPGTEAAPAPGEVSPGASPAAALPDGAAPSQPAPAAAVPGATPAQAPVDIAGMVDQQLAQREEELRKQLEAQQKKLEKELEKSKASGQPTPQNAVASAQPTPAAEPSPSPAATVVPPPSPSPEPEPAAATPQQAAAPPPEPSPEPERVPSPTAPVAEAGDVVPPQLVSSPKPQYPPVARRMRAEGTVVVSVLVDEKGQVQDARVTQPASQKVLNDEALKVARAARFRPATKNGVRVKMWTRLTIPFKL